MNTTDLPAFSSPELKVALDNAREALEGADEARNRVSQDIKALERYLAGLRLATPFRYSLGKRFQPEDEQSVAASIEYGGTASGKIEEEALILDEDTHGKTRLLYVVSQWEGYVDVDMPGGPFFWDESTIQQERKPLIEAKFEVRKQAYDQLPAFVTALAEHYAIIPSKLANLDDEIPF